MGISKIFSFQIFNIIVTSWVDFDCTLVNKSQPNTDIVFIYKYDFKENSNV